jgi:superfamily II DNA or RNA helicase
MVIVDEFHHSAAHIYELVKYFQAKYLIGLTATDDRNDGLKEVLNWYFGDVAFRYTERIINEDILPYTVIIHASKIVFNPKPVLMFYGKEIDEEYANYLRSKKKRVVKKPLSIHEMREVLMDEEFNDMVCNDIFHEYSLNKSCIAFSHEKEHLKFLKELLINKGVPENQIQYYSGDSTESNSELKRRAESKEVLITLATYAKATEGTNVKAWERGFFVSSMNNQKDVIQAAGRLRRKKEGKKDVIIYDYDHPRAAGLCNHLKTRLLAYETNKAKVEFQKRPQFTRGF